MSPPTAEEPAPDLTVQCGTLQRALAAVLRAAPSRSSLPVLNNALLDAQANGLLRLTMTDLELAVTQFVGAEVVRPVQLTIPARTLQDTLKGLPDEAMLALTHVAKTESLHYAAAKPHRRQATLRGISAEEFPAGVFCPELTAGSLSLPGAVAAAALERIRPAIALDEARPVLHGLHFRLRPDGVLTLEAADGFRLHSEDLHTTTLGRDVSVIMPLKAVGELVRLIDREAEVVIDLLGQGGAYNQIVFAQDGWQLTARLIEGQFPDLNAVIPKKSTVQAVAPWDALHKAIQGGAGIAREVSQTGRFKLHGGSESAPGQLSLKIVSAVSGNYEADMDAVVSGAPEFEFACNIAFLQDALNALDAGQVTLGLSSPSSPILLREQAFTAVLMPMHLGK